MKNYTIDISKESNIRLSELAISKRISKSELIRRALRFYSEVDKEIGSNRGICSFEKNIDGNHIVKKEFIIGQG